MIATLQVDSSDGHGVEYRQKKICEMKRLLSERKIGSSDIAK